MLKVNSMKTGKNTQVCVFENVPDNFDEILQRIVNEANSTSFKFSNDTKYGGLTLKEAILKDGKEAVFYAYAKLPFVTDPEYYASIVDTLKFFVRWDKEKYSFDEILKLKILFQNEIENYKKIYCLDLETVQLDENSKNKIKNYILY